MMQVSEKKFWALKNPSGRRGLVEGLIFIQHGYSILYLPPGK
jgi:hypothetical protein